MYSGLVRRLHLDNPAVEQLPGRNDLYSRPRVTRTSERDFRATFDRRLLPFLLAPHALGAVDLTPESVIDAFDATRHTRVQQDSNVGGRFLGIDALLVVQLVGVQADYRQIGWLG